MGPHNKRADRRKIGAVRNLSDRKIADKTADKTAEKIARESVSPLCSF